MLGGVDHPAAARPNESLEHVLPRHRARWENVRSARGQHRITLLGFQLARLLDVELGKVGRIGRAHPLCYTVVSVKNLSSAEESRGEERGDDDAGERFAGDRAGRERGNVLFGPLRTKEHGGWRTPCSLGIWHHRATPGEEKRSRAEPADGRKRAARV